MFKSFCNTVCAVASVLLLVACNGEDNTDAAVVGNTEPITVTAMHGAFHSSTPSTRVADTDNTSSVSSSWTDGDRICVSVRSLLTDKRQTSVCTLKSNGSVTQYSPQLYWQNRGSYTFNAWYSNIGDSPTADTAADIADQTIGGLPYVLKAEPVVVTYIGKRGLSVPLVFKQQLAKVRVKLVDSGGNGISPENVAVWIRNCYTSCSVDEGTVTPVGKADGYVKMMPPKDAGGYYQANVIPDVSGTVRQTYAVEIKIGDKTTGADLAEPVTFEKGKVYTIVITVS